MADFHYCHISKSNKDNRFRGKPAGYLKVLPDKIRKALNLTYQVEGGFLPVRIGGYALCKEKTSLKVEHARLDLYVDIYINLVIES